VKVRQIRKMVAIAVLSERECQISCDGWIGANNEFILRLRTFKDALGVSVCMFSRFK